MIRIRVTIRIRIRVRLRLMVRVRVRVACVQRVKKVRVEVSSSIKRPLAAIAMVAVSGT